MKKVDRINKLLKTIKKKELQKYYSKQHKKSWIFWIGFSTFGLIGWSVIVPTFVGIGLGIWIDQKWPSSIPWTLTLTISGLIMGCWSAWFWISKERTAIEKEKNDRK